MKIETKVKIVEAAKAYIKKHKMTQTDFAQKADVRNEYLTHMLREGSDFTVPTGRNKPPTLIADRYFRNVADFIGLQLKATYWEVQPTKELQRSLSILKDAKENGETVLLIGETGSGKTHAVELFRKKFPVDTYVVTVGSTDNLGDLIEKIVEALNITTGKTKSKRLQDIARKLRRMHDDGLKPSLILDEAEYMRVAAICSIKELYDHVFRYASLVLVGTSQLTDKLDVLRKRNKPGIPQFYRRIKFGIRTLPSIDTSFKLFLEGLDREVQKFIRSICDNYGEVHDVLVPVRRESERTGESITVDFICKVLELPRYNP